ncbi:hypothetical protein BH09SUM1_BH09SUM1_24560 [soil metagenome]
MIKLTLLLCICVSMPLGACAALDPELAWDSLKPDQRALWKGLLAPEYGNMGEAEVSYKTMYSIVAEADEAGSPSLVMQTCLCASRIMDDRFRKQTPAPTDENLREYVAGSPLSFARKERINLDSIFLRRFDSEKMESVRARAGALKAALDSGRGFGELAEEYSDAKSRAIRGSAGSIDRGQLPQDLENLLFALPTGKTVGPIERDHGIYYWRVTKKLGEFSLENPEDRERAATGWMRSQIGNKGREMAEAYKSAHVVEVHAEPANRKSWLEDPWISVDGKPALLYSDLFMLVTEDAPALPDAKEWSDDWRDEGALRSGQMIGALAAVERLGHDDAQLPECAKIASVMSAGKQLIHSRYQELTPSESDIKAFYESQVDVIDPLSPRYTALVWNWPPASLADPKIKGNAFAEQFNKALDEVYQKTSSNTPSTAQDAEALMKKLCLDFPGSGFKRVDKVESLGPFTDPIFYRTKPGALSLPFDKERQVSLVYMIDRTEARHGIDALRDEVRARWVGQELQRFIDAHRPSDDALAK